MSKVTVIMIQHRVYLFKDKNQVKPLIRDILNKHDRVRYRRENSVSERLALKSFQNTESEV